MRHYSLSFLISLTVYGFGWSQPATPEAQEVALPSEADGGFGLGSVLPNLTAVPGIGRIDGLPNAPFLYEYATTNAHYGQYFSPSQRLMITVGGGPRVVGVDLDYRFQTSEDTFASLFVNHTRLVSPAFAESVRPQDSEPWLYRTSAGAAYNAFLAEDWSASLAVYYQWASLHSGVASNRLSGRNSFGESLLASGGRRDESVRARLSIGYSELDHPLYPTSGDRLRLTLEKAFRVGTTDLNTTTGGLQYTHWEPLSWLGDTRMLFNLQAATSLGRVAPYDGFFLGGPNSVRGYRVGELGGGSSCVQSSLELRQPLGSLQLFGSEVSFLTSGFVDYGSSLGSQSRVLGQPAIAREKPDSGLSAGVGLLAETDLGLVRLEAAWAQGSRSAVWLSLGDRY